MGRAVRSLFHASSRRDEGHMTESIPRRFTPRSRNGMTVCSSLLPPASPTAATDPAYLVCARTRASVLPPTESMHPAQRSVSKGRLDGSTHAERSTTAVAPRFFKYSWVSARPVDATTCILHLA